MKKLLLLLALILPFASCRQKENKTEIIQKESEAIIQKQLLNGESLEVQSIKIVKDSVPYVLDMQLQQLYDEFSEANDKFIQVRDSYGYSNDEYLHRLRKAANAGSEYYSMRDSLKTLPKDYGYIALVDFVAKNTAGADLTSKAIVVYTDTVKLKPEGIFILTSEDNQRIYGMLQVDDDFTLVSNKYGMINTDSLDNVIGFILDGQRVK